MFRNLQFAASLILLASFGASAAEIDFADWTDKQKEAFLLSADISKIEMLNRGVTRPQRAILESEGVAHYAHIQSVEVHKLIFSGPRSTEANFRDSYKFNIAAYRLDRMVGLNLVPVSVERRTRRKGAAFTWWIDGARMTEGERRRKRLEPPNPADWEDQMLNLRVFNELLYNVDANLGNIVVTEDWLPRPVDFTRSFRLHKKLRDPANLYRIDRRFYEGLQRLTQEQLVTELGDLLAEEEIEALLARRDLIVEFFDKKAAEQGESAAICDREGH
jgi:hypothetical protein